MGMDDQKQEGVEQEIKEDPFSLFMFGSRGTKHSDGQVEEGRNTDHNWLFGNHPNNGGNTQHNQFANTRNNQTLDTLNGLLQNVNLEELMGHVDTIMTSVGQLKPLLKKVKPFMQQLIK